MDLLIRVDNAELHYSRADLCGEVGEPVARLRPLGWTCIGSPEGKQGTEHTLTVLCLPETLMSVSAMINMMLIITSRDSGR